MVHPIRLFKKQRIVSLNDVAKFENETAYQNVDKSPGGDSPLNI